MASTEHAITNSFILDHLSCNYVSAQSCTRSFLEQGKRLKKNITTQYSEQASTVPGYSYMPTYLLLLINNTLHMLQYCYDLQCLYRCCTCFKGLGLECCSSTCSLHLSFRALTREQRSETTDLISTTSKL